MRFCNTCIVVETFFPLQAQRRSQILGRGDVRATGAGFHPPIPRVRVYAIPTMGPERCAS